MLNEAFADQVIEFIEMEERIQEAPFDRYADLSGLTHIRIGIDHIIHTARHRRKVKQPVKSALFADNSLSFSVTHSYELLMCDAVIEVRAFQGARRGGGVARGASQNAGNALGKRTKDYKKSPDSTDNNKAMTL